MAEPLSKLGHPDHGISSGVEVVDDSNVHAILVGISKGRHDFVGLNVVGALQTDDDGDSQADVLSSGDDSVGNQGAVDDSSEDVDEDGLD